jgi:uncharacterized protein YutE (UPF0331/DUF86 family)
MAPTGDDLRQKLVSLASYADERNRIVHDYDRVDGQEIVRRATQLPADVRALLGVLTST